MIISNMVRGMFMAFADSVPGVSGGTIAFVMGFYDAFIGSLNTLVSSKSSLEEKKKALVFLIKIGAGWALGMIVAMLFIGSVFTAQIYRLSSLFIGFILFSIPLIYNEEKKILSNKKQYVIFTIIGIALVALITYFSPSTGASGISLEHFSLGLALYVFFAGMIAISAMVLPGISGSTLLLIFGLYGPITSNLKEILTFNFQSLPLIICFGFGVIAGVFTTIRVINAVLKTRRPQLIYFIIGLMIGSIYAVIMGPTTLEEPQPAMNLSHFSLVFFAIGGLTILGLEQLKKKMSAK